MYSYSIKFLRSVGKWLITSGNNKMAQIQKTTENKTNIHNLVLNNQHGELRKKIELDFWSYDHKGNLICMNNKAIHMFQRKLTKHTSFCL